LDPVPERAPTDPAAAERHHGLAKVEIRADPPKAAAERRNLRPPAVWAGGLGLVRAPADPLEMFGGQAV
jgi:hypothetical protein